MPQVEKKFNGFTDETIKFLNELKFNNDKTWFESNRETYIKHVKNLFYDLIADLNPTMISIDPQFEMRPEKIISRIYRDTRFSYDKSPYKTNVWITYKKTIENWMDYPAYFFELFDDSYRYGMGFYSATKDTMDLLRKGIKKNQAIFINDFNRIINNNNFIIEGEMYKRKIANDLSEELQIWYQRKNLYFTCNKKIDENLFSNKLVSNLIDGFELLKPIYYFLLKMKG